MPAVSPTPILAYSGALPDPSDRATYGARGRALWDWEVNTLLAGVNANSAAAFQNAQFSETMALASAAAANFKGHWSGLSGALAVPAMVFHDDEYWLLATSLPDVAAEEPSDLSTVWTLFSRDAGSVKYGAGSVADALDLIPGKVSKTGAPQVMEVDLTVPSLNGGAFGPGNVLINGTGQIAQEALGSRTDDTYAEDGWIVLTQTAAVTASTVTDAEDGTPFMMRLLQAQASPQHMGRLQIIEASKSKHWRGQTLTARFGRVRESVVGTVRYALLAWTGTADVVTSDVVNNWASTSFTPGNFFLASNLSVIATGSHALAANTLTDGVSLTGVVPSGCNNLILFAWTDAAVAQNVTLDLAKARINPGAVATPYLHSGADVELLDCSRFAVPLEGRRPMGQAVSASAVTSVSVITPVPMRVTPSISASSHAFTRADGGSTAGFTVAVTSMVGAAVRLDASGGSTLVAGNASIMVPAANTWLLARL